MFGATTGQALPLSNRLKMTVPGLPNPTYSATVGSITVNPQFCSWCPKQYASKPKLLQHQRKKHPDQIRQLKATRVNKEQPSPSKTKQHSGSPNIVKINTIITTGEDGQSDVRVTTVPNDDSLPSIIKTEEGDNGFYKNIKLDNELKLQLKNDLFSSQDNDKDDEQLALKMENNHQNSTSNELMDNFDISSSDFIKNNSSYSHVDDNGHSSSNFFFDDLLGVTIVSDDHHSTNGNLIQHQNPAYGNNIITILGKMNFLWFIFLKLTRFLWQSLRTHPTMLPTSLQAYQTLSLK